jgi:hypothetical protein
LLQVGTMRRFDEGIAFARDFIRDELGELFALKAWYSDSAYRYTMTDALQPLARASVRARTPPVDPGRTAAATTCSGTGAISSTRPGTWAATSRG